jgi:hypothetical protein
MTAAILRFGAFRLVSCSPSGGYPATLDKSSYAMRRGCSFLCGAILQNAGSAYSCAGGSRAHT